MSFDPAALLAMDPIVTHQALSARDTMLYALGIGATELEFTYEDGLKALPTMPGVMAYPGFLWARPEFKVDWKRVLYGEQSTEIHAPLPVEAALRGETVVEAIYDKGADKGSIAVLRRRIFDDSNETLLATIRATSFLRGDGGHGGSEGRPREPHLLPDRAPDDTITLPTTKTQAAIYRLSGDYNPLHVDPKVAAAAGFERPILHGLCTYGVAGRALLSAICPSDSSRITRIDVRFSSPVFPGETIITDIWREGEGRAAFRSRVAERDVMVLNNGYAEFD